MRLDIKTDKYIPEYLLVDGNRLGSGNWTYEMKRNVLLHGKPAQSLKNKPFMKYIYEECNTSIMNYGGPFTGKDFLEESKIRTKSGHVIQWLLKDARGGGQSSNSWGCVHFHKENLIKKIFTQRGIWEEFSAIPKTKQPNRIPKYLCELHDLTVEPRVKITPKYPYEGMIFMSPSYMKLCNIPFGAKTAGALKALALPTLFDMDNCDICVPVHENKLGLSEAKLAKEIFLNRSISPQLMFSKNLKTLFNDKLGRNPGCGFDLASSLGRLPDLSKLEMPKKLWYGQATVEEIIANLFSYTNKIGEVKLTKEGNLILEGKALKSPEIWPEAERKIWRLVKKNLQPRIKGKYGIVLPNTVLKSYKAKGVKMRGWLTRFPWTLPILTTVSIWRHCIFVDEELWNTFGGDYDGDQGAVYEQDSIQGNLIWERDKDFIQEHMVLPAKIESFEDNRSMEEVIAAQLDHYASCGPVYNISKSIVDAARHQGMSAKEVLALDMTLQSQYVQPTINGIKYMVTDKNDIDMKTVGNSFGVLTANIKRSSEFYSLWKGKKSSIETLKSMGEKASEESTSFFESLTVKVHNEFFNKKVESSEKSVNMVGLDKP